MLPNKTNILSYFIRDLKDQDTFNQSNKFGRISIYNKYEGFNPIFYIQNICI